MLSASLIPTLESSSSPAISKNRFSRAIVASRECFSCQSRSIRNNSPPKSAKLSKLKLSIFNLALKLAAHDYVQGNRSRLRSNCGGGFLFRLPALNPARRGRRHANSLQVRQRPADRKFQRARCTQCPSPIISRPKETRRNRRFGG